MENMNIFEQFDATVDLMGLKADVEAAAENTGERREVPTGEYEVRVEKMELTFSKKGDPMFTCWMRVIAGEYQNQMVFYNQLLTKAFQIHLIKQFLTSMKTNVMVDFMSYSQFAQNVADVFAEIDGKKEFALVIGEKNNFKNYTIMQVFDVANG